MPPVLGDFRTVPIPNAAERVLNQDGSFALAWWMFLQGMQIAVPAEGATPLSEAGITQLTGDVTAGPGSGSQLATIAANAVTYAKMQDVTAASRLLGRGSAAGAGDPQEISLGSGLSMAGTTLSATGSVTVTGTPASGDLTMFSGASSITSWTSAATSAIGRAANSAGDPADIAASANQQILGRRSDVLGFTAIQAFGYWAPITNGSATAPELIFDSFGDCVVGWVAT